MVQLPTGQYVNSYNVVTFESGELKEVYLAESQWVDTPAGKLILKNGISFSESGKLKAGRLAEDITINGIKYSASDSIGWDEQGKFLGEVKWVSEK